MSSIVRVLSAAQMRVGTERERANSWTAWSEVRLDPTSCLLGHIFHETGKK